MADSPSDGPVGGKHRLAISALAAAVALAIIVMWMPYLVPRSWVKAWTVAGFRERLNTPFTLSSVRLRGWGAIELRGLTVGGEPPMLEVDRARVAFSPLSLLGGAIRLRNMEVDGARFRPALTEDGRWNFAPIARSCAGELSLLPEMITLKNVTVVPSAVPLARNWAEADLNMRVRPAADGLRRRVQGAAALGGGEDALRVRFGAAVGAHSPPRSVGTWLVTFQDGLLSLGPPSAETRLELSRIAGILARGPSGTRAYAQFRMDGEDLQADLAYTGPVGAGETHLHLSGSSMDLGAIVALLAHSGAAHPDEEAPKASQRALSGLSGRIEVDLEELILPPHLFNGLHIRASASNGLVTVPETGLRYNSGRVVFSGAVDLSSGPPRWEVRLDAEQVEPRDNLRPVLDALTGRIRPEGPFDASATFSATGFSLDSLWRSLDGRLVMDFGGGHCRIDRPPRYVTRVFPPLDTTSLPFKAGGGSWRFNGNVVNYDIRFRADVATGLGCFAKGTSDLKNRTQSMEFGVDMLRSMGVRLRADSDLKGTTDVVLFRTSGPFAERVDQQWYRVHAENVAGLVKQILWDDPIVLVDPGTSMAEKGRLIRRRLQAVFGVAIKPLILFGDGAKWLLDGAHRSVRGLLQAIVGEDAEDSPPSGEGEEDSGGG